MKCRWYIDGSINRPKTWVGGTYTLDGDYKPVQVCITARESGEGSTPLVLDINDDGTSIFDSTYRPALTEYQTDKTWTTVKANTLREGSIVTLDIDQVFNVKSCRDLTVELDLEES